MSNFDKLFDADLKRYNNNPSRWQRKFHYYFRKAQTSKSKALSGYYRFRFALIKRKNLIEISEKTSIGGGLYIGHPYCITINPKAVLGKNINIHRGVLIGQENRGTREGAPTIGNNVWIGINSSIVGNIKIGDNVLIAPNTFINCDVPSNSVVFGNPCVIKHSDKAVEKYINCEVDI